jgi:hypothetical protein
MSYFSSKSSSGALSSVAHDETLIGDGTLSSLLGVDPSWFATNSVLANTGLWVGLTGNENIDGIKNFTDFPTKAGSLLPLNSNQFVTKDYADAIALGFKFKHSVNAATTVPLSPVTYYNGPANDGIGATLTANANGLIDEIDSYAPQVGDRLLIKDQVDPIENGIYVVTDIGSVSTDFILTRADDFNSTSTIGQGSATLVLEGTPYAPPGSVGNYASQFAVLTNDPITPGFNQIIWSRISLPIQYFAGAGLLLTGTTFSLDTSFVSPVSEIYGSTLYSSALSGTGTGSATGGNNIFGVRAAQGATLARNSNIMGPDAGNGATGTVYDVNWFGRGAGFQAINAIASNFFGANAGNGASAGDYSNMFGAAAGFGATNASYSNFFGRDAGRNATNANNSNFIGHNAGKDATNSNDSTFIGTDAGNVATNAFQSVFLGTQSGYLATFAQSSTFLGTGAGFNATAASGSVMIGRDSGSGSTGAVSSIFVGNASGGNATNAQHSNFFGVSAGQNATNAFYSTFIGEQAGQNSTTAANSIFIGTNAGRNDFVDNTVSGTSILIGDNTSTGGFKNSIAIGTGATNTAVNQLLIAPAYTQLNMRGLNYTMPSTNVLGVLNNDGAGNLSWGAAVSQFQFLRNTSKLSRTNSVVLTLVPGMTANVTSGKTYQFTATLLTTSANTGGVKAAITLAGGATGTIAYQGDTVQNGVAPVSTRAAASNIAVGAVTAVTSATITIRGTFVCTASGVMRVTFGQNVAAATPSVVLANSIFQVTQIN